MLAANVYEHAYWNSGAPSAPHPVIGVVGDTRHTNLRDQPRPELYLPGITKPAVSARLPRTLVVRAAPGVSVASAIRTTIQRVEPNAPYITVKALGDLIAPSFRPWLIGATMFSVFGALALTLALLGIYGSTSSLVSARQHEIGVRMALGATPLGVGKLVLIRAIAIALIGSLCGALIAYAAAPRVETLLFDIHARSGPVFGLTITLVVLATILACLPPVSRAMRVDVRNVLDAS